MQEVAGSQGQTDAPAAIVGAGPIGAAATSAGWNSLVAKAPPIRRRRRAWPPIVVGLLVTIGPFLLLAFVTSDPRRLLDQPDLLRTAVLALGLASLLFWIWMLIDAVSASRLGWVGAMIVGFLLQVAGLALIPLGTLAALGYAALGRGMSSDP
jgi:hypothetical protein